jgi:hypothetical protein
MYIYCLPSTVVHHAAGPKEMSSILAYINSALVYEPKCGGGGTSGSQPMGTAVHRSPNKL